MAPPVSLKSAEATDTLRAHRHLTEFANRAIMARLKAGISAGLRLVTRPRSTTTSSSIHEAPALRMSVLSDGHEVIFLPRTRLASTSVQGPWQMAATGLPASTIDLTNLT